MPTKNAPFVKRLGNALSGVSHAFQMEASFRFQVLAAIGAFIFLGVMNASAIWWGIFTLNIAAVLSAELINTALEQFMDLMHPQLHPSVKVAKDCAAGAVLLLSLSAIAILFCFLWITILN